MGFRNLTPVPCIKHLTPTFLGFWYNQICDEHGETRTVLWGGGAISCDGPDLLTLDGVGITRRMNPVACING